jgi:predicted RNA-binding protein YlxR (DUF448 family)
MLQTTPKRLARPNDDVHGPVRQCVACRTRAEKRTLLRFVQTSMGQWEYDPAARREGRGAYLCSPDCAQRVSKNKRYKGMAAAGVPPDAWRR